MTTSSTDDSAPEHLSDPVLVVEALELLQVYGFTEAAHGTVDAEEDLELSEQGPGLLLRVTRARRAGYMARRNNAPVDTCPFPVGEDAAATRLRAGWMAGWMLRQLAELARPGEQMPTPSSLGVGIGESESSKLSRAPFYREFVHFAKVAAKRKLFARTWKAGARALFDALHVDPANTSWQAAMRRKMSFGLAESFLAAGGVNRVEWPTRFTDDRLGEMALVLERVEGKSAGVLIAEAKEQITALQRALDDYHERYRAPHATDAFWDVLRIEYERQGSLWDDSENSRAYWYKLVAWRLAKAFYNPGPHASPEAEKAARLKRLVSVGASLAKWFVVEEAKAPPADVQRDDAFNMLKMDAHLVALTTDYTYLEAFDRLSKGASVEHLQREAEPFNSRHSTTG